MCEALSGHEVSDVATFISSNHRNRAFSVMQRDLFENLVMRRQSQGGPWAHSNKLPDGLFDSAIGKV